MLALIADPRDAHRRRVWEAFRVTGGRTGRWGALVKLGVTLRAWPADELDAFEPYREPKRLETKMFPVAGEPFGTYQRVVIDPEDADEPQPEVEAVEPKPRRRALAH